MSATLFLKRALIDDLTGLAPFTPPPLYLSLHTADPGVLGSHVYEVSNIGTGYSRISLVGQMSAADVDTGISSNTVALTFGPALISWSTIRFLGLEGALTGGDMLAPGVPSIPKTINIGGSFQLAPGQLRLRVN